MTFMLQKVTDERHVYVNFLKGAGVNMGMA